MSRSGVDAGADRHAAREVVAVVTRGYGDQRLGVRPDEMAEPRGELGQRALQPAALQKRVGPQRPARDNDAARRVHRPVPAQPGARALAGDGVAVRAVAGAERADVYDHPFGDDGGADALGEPEVVLCQDVLRVVAAADHACAGCHAAAAWRALAAEIGIGNALAGIALENGHPRGAKRLAVPVLLRDLAEQAVSDRLVLVVRDPEHPFDLVIVGSERAFPILQVGPLRVGEEARRGAVVDGAVDQAASPHAGPAEDRHVLEDRHAQRAT